ncbi:hypothetical protein CRG98_037822 [Punica granatum]|uniref:Uncharacterized protein n=1 Tax=Punica granatum TaxID=22663 RepID=A0A2I0ICR7_PUNGR|nr:hypothetical protein CRG98_037822 [Punica granatum]
MDPELAALLKGFEDIFEEPKDLPPKRAQNHRIPLKKASQPVNIRPYRYPTLQKDIIEKMTAEMMEACMGFSLPCMPYFPHDSAVAAVDTHMRDREGMIRALKHHLQRARKMMKLQADKKRSDRKFSIGDMVFLKLQPYRQGSVTARGSEKLSPKYYGPYQIMDRIGKVAYKLKLPSSDQVHPVFHVSRLKKAIGTATCSSELPIPYDTSECRPLQPLAILERRMVKRGNKATAQLLVHWSNTSSNDATWEYADELRLCFPQFRLVDKGLEGEGNVMD